MPTTPTYPGVYVEEIPSGVRTITGVSTSVAAFVGEAKRGPINKAVRIRNFGDYERAFGGLASGSEMSYAVRQFFLNGGSEAFIVRLAKNATLATRTLQNTAPADVLIVTALDEGGAANNIEVRVDHQTSNPASTFNLTINYVSPDNPATDSVSERFENLSMNSADPRYVEKIVNGSSALVKVQRSAGLNVAGQGRSTSGTLPNDATLATRLDATHNQFRVSVNNLPPVTVQLTPPNMADVPTLAGAIQGIVQTAANSVPAYNNFTCAANLGNDQLVLTSGVAGENSSVRVLPGERNDIAARLALGTLNGGTETDAAATIRPRELPDRGSLRSGQFAAADMASVAAANNKFNISIDGQGPDTVTLDPGPLAGANIGARLAVLAPQIQAKVRALKPAVKGYKDFTVTVDGPDRLLLSSGARGTGSSVVVTAASANDIAALLHLNTGTTAINPTNVNLQNGNDEAITPDVAYSLYIGSRAQRRGIYALETHFFNILCMPGVADPGTLSDADSYCKERRAFMVVDSPKGQKPDQMATVASGPDLPKTDHGAVYYPWINVADPLNGGKLRTSAPCGAIAGLYARTDSTRGVWKAPAGMDATLSGVLGTEYVLTDGENGTLNPLGVNAIRQFPVFGNVVWGARTLRGADAMASEYKYVPVRRLALFIEESLYQGTKWVVFEPNDEPLWAQIRLNLGAFMNNLFRQGAFQGQTPRDAYFVKCDRETTTQNDINLGIVNIIVGFAPLKPAEFVIIRIQQIAGAIQT